MRNGILLSLLVAVIGLTHGSDLLGQDSGRGWLRDVDQALRVAAAQQRPLLLYITMDGCTYCTKMVQTTLSHPDVRKLIGSSYVAAAIKNSERPDLMQKLKIRSFPTTLLVSPKGQILNQMNGYVDARRFQRQLADAASPRQARAATQAPAPVRHRRPPATPQTTSEPKAGWSLPFGLGRSLGRARQG